MLLADTPGWKSLLGHSKKISLLPVLLSSVLVNDATSNVTNESAMLFVLYAIRRIYWEES